MSAIAENHRIYLVLKDGTEVELDGEIKIVDFVHIDIHDLITSVLIMREVKENE
jgi:hypothetical protein